MPEFDLAGVKIHDWDPRGSELLRQGRYRLLDTTLRDGVQAPGIKQPTLAEKFSIIDFDARVGVEEIDVCLPADPDTRYFKEGVECARYIAANYPKIDIVVLTRTIPSDVAATVEFARLAGVQGKLKSILFRGTSDLRLIAENWDRKGIIDGFGECTRQLVSSGIRVVGATEDTTRTGRKFLKSVFEACKDNGAEEFCVADTVGSTDPFALSNQMRWLRAKVVGQAPIHYHGHNDTWNSVANTSAAMRFGTEKANVIAHVTWLGVGERTGNTPIEGLLSDLLRRGINRYDPSSLVEAAQLVSSAYRIPIPDNHPLVGKNAFKSESGIHIAAIEKALKSGREDIAGVVYSPVDPRLVGRELEAEIGPLGGVHSTKMKLGKMDIPWSEQLNDALLKAAKVKNQALTEDEIRQLVGAINGSSLR